MSIPASRVVVVNPGVIIAGGTSLALNGLWLTQNALMPVGKVYNFSSASAVSAFFGPASDEAALALIYFQGFDNSTIKPNGMLFAAFNLTARAGYLQSGNLSALTLTALKAMSGTITLSQDGVSKTSSAITLTGATSFSNAATLIAAAFTGGPAVTWNPVNSTFVFTSPTTGATSSISFATGTLATGLALTSATGALISQGAIADTPVSAMTNAINISQNFGTFSTVYEPVAADKLAYWVWASGTNSRFLYAGWDSDPQASTMGSTTSVGYIGQAAAYDSGIMLSGDPNYATANGTTLAALARNLAAFFTGAVASINFGQTNGRITLKFRSSTLMTPTVDNDQISQNLLANGYSFYGAFATASNKFNFFSDGALVGKWNWVDAFVNQVYLNAQFQLAVVTLLTEISSVPYNPSGYGLIRSALMDPINDALDFGTIRTGVTLSTLEAAALNTAAGTLEASSQVQTEGFYLQILDPGATIRALRGTPIVNFWYTDGGAVQFVSMGSINIQ